MSDIPASPATQRRLCPTCGSRVGEAATRCVVCGADLRRASASPAAARRSQLTLSMPMAVGLLAGFVLVGAGATYRPLFNLNLDLTGQLQWNESPDTSGTNMRGNLHVSYFLPLPGTPTLDLNGTWEHATVTDENRIEFRSQLSYRLGQVNFRLEHRVERKEAQGQSGLNNSVHFSVVRPFRFSFN